MFLFTRRYSLIPSVCIHRVSAVQIIAGSFLSRTITHLTRQHSDAAEAALLRCINRDIPQQRMTALIWTHSATAIHPPDLSYQRGGQSLMDPHGKTLVPTKGKLEGMSLSVLFLNRTGSQLLFSQVSSQSAYFGTDYRRVIGHFLKLKVIWCRALVFKVEVCASKTEVGACHTISKLKSQPKCKAFHSFLP